MLKILIDIIKFLIKNSTPISDQAEKSIDSLSKDKEKLELDNAQIKKTEEVRANNNPITIDILLMGRAKLEDLPPDFQENIRTLNERVNKFFEGYEWSSNLKKVNDGYRRPQDTPKNGSATSWHYKGAAVDIDDDDFGTRWRYVWENRQNLKDIGLWMEHPNWTHGNGSWLHFQIYPPKSGRRFFIPSTKPASAPNFWDGKYEKDLDQH